MTDDVLFKSNFSASIAFGIFAVLSFFIRSKARKELLECGFAEVYIPLYGILTRLNRWFSGFSPPIFWLDHTWPKRTWAGENPWLSEEIFGFTDELRDISCAKCGPKVFIPSEHHPDGYILFRCWGVSSGWHQGIHPLSTGRATKQAGRAWRS